MHQGAFNSTPKVEVVLVKDNQKQNYNNNFQKHVLFPPPLRVGSGVIRGSLGANCNVWGPWGLGVNPVVTLTYCCYLKSRIKLKLQSSRNSKNFF